MLGKGYVQVYTGTGKGKTTAALGLVLRACGAGLRVFLGQFLKAKHYSELTALERFSDLVTIRQFGSGEFVNGHPSPEDHRRARAGFEEAKDAVRSGRYSMVVLDEANMAVHYSVIPVEELIELIRAKPHGVELVITGRHAKPRLIEEADLVTEMREVKHYYVRGVEARRGVEK